MAHPWHALNREETLAALRTTAEGLTSQQARRRLKTTGRNEIRKKRPFGVLRVLVNQLKSFFSLLLLGAGLVSFLLGNAIDSYVILGAVFLNVFFGFAQELKANQTLRRLKEQIAHVSIVLRDREERHVDVRELVPGDIVRVSQGERVPADIRLLEVKNLAVNEAMLTGEAEPKAKAAEKMKAEALVAERRDILYQGTIIVRGQGTGVVVATGEQTELGKISLLLRTAEEQMTPLQVKIDRFSKWLSVFILALVSLLFIAGVAAGREVAEIFVVAVAVAVSAIPEGLIIAITIILAIGMLRLLKRNALVRRLSSAETLGATTVICSDKTGTLTRGEMAVDRTAVQGGESAEALMKEIALYGVTARIANPRAPENDWRYEGYPTETALLRYAMEDRPAQFYLDRRKHELDHLLFDETNRYQLALVAGRKRNRLFIVGAPEVVLEHCGQQAGLSGINRLTESGRAALTDDFRKLSRAGFRVLGAAWASLPLDTVTIEPNPLPEFTFTGFYALRDPLREGVRETIAEAARAGVRTVMITGDHLLTARAIAKDLGLHSSREAIMDGRQLDRLSVGELRKLIPGISVFARVAPADKVRIVEAFQLNDNVVAMTGDGVNDAPALKRADIGVAMGAGQDVSKEVSDLVLLDNNFNTIVAAISQGRSIFDNIQKVITYLLSDSFTEVILVGVSILLGLPLPLTAAQILWVNLIADGPPNIALAFEPEEPDVMKRRPQRLSKMPLLTNEIKFIIFAVGIVTDIILLGLFLLLWLGTRDIVYTRTMVFVGLAIDSLIYVFSIRSLRTPIWRMSLFENRYLLLAVGLSFAMLLLAVYTPALQRILQTVGLSIIDWTLLIILAIIQVIGIEAAKWGFNRRSK